MVFGGEDEGEKEEEGCVDNHIDYVRVSLVDGCENQTLSKSRVSLLDRPSVRPFDRCVGESLSEAVITDRVFRSDAAAV